MTSRPFTAQELADTDELAEDAAKARAEESAWLAEHEGEEPEEEEDDFPPSPVRPGEEWRKRLYIIIDGKPYPPR